MGNSHSSSSTSSSLSNSWKSIGTETNIKTGYKTTQDLHDIDWYTAIKTKLQNDDHLFGTLSETELNELIYSLGDEKTFLDRYLNIKEVYNDDHLKQIKNDLEELYDHQAYNNVPLSEQEGRNLINGLLQHRSKSDKFNVYLYISKLSGNRSEIPLLRDIAKNTFKNKYGMFHVGLEIDGIVLEWGTGDAGPNLIYPKFNPHRIYDNIAHIRVNYDSNLCRELNNSITFYSKNWSNLYKPVTDLFSLILNMFKKLLNDATHIGFIPTNKLQIVARKCVFWNKNYYYSATNRNCQQFIEEMLKSLGLKFEPEAEFKKFMDRITGHADDRFLFKEEEFFSRYDLDQYADQNWDRISNIWDKKLLLCYSNMMDGMYKSNGDSTWGPKKNKGKWQEREYELRVEY
ncbi:hypothetical protein C1645_825597 [Glomus cerebriforme]|uniref:Uncharacterized protein n=1 Tax=Glomus cerebriforme TaxID=658196 RepID=A0A397SSD5_9GLOM|nr:hypothetical protein C1645_825597 [Glomus cerebriforme]